MDVFARSLGRVQIPGAAEGAIPHVDWVPENEDEAAEWGAEQAARWADPAVDSALRGARDVVQNELAHDIDLSNPLTEDEGAAWAADYIYRNGPPTNPEEGARMLRRFLDEQGQTMGIHPAFVYATDLLVDFPLDDPAQALEWTAEVGVSFAQQYGIPLTTDFDTESMIVTSATAGLTQAGVPFAGALTTTAQTLFDGTVTQDELARLAGMVGSVVGASLGQMFGIPAPIGSFIGSVVTTLIFEGLGKLFGWGPSTQEKRATAFAAASEAAEAVEVKCIELGFQAWTEYQRYWSDLVRNVQQSLQAESLWLAGGLRYFNDAYIDQVEVGPEQCRSFSYEQLARAAAGQEIECYAPLPAVIDRDCRSPAGCKYFSKYPQNPGLWLRKDETGFANVPGHTFPDNTPLVEYRYVEDGAKIDGEVSARAALLFYGAFQFVTPYHAYRTFVHLEDYRSGATQLSLLAPGVSERVGMGRRIRPWESTLQTDRAYIENLAHVPVVPGNEFGGYYALGDCDTQRWAVQLFNSLLQCGPATALISRDISATISAAMVEYKLAQQARQQSIQQTAARAAQARRDLLMLRREKQRVSRNLNGALLGVGGGALAGWAAASILG